MRTEAIRLIILADHETQNREFKQSFAWDHDTEIVAKVVRTILAMANLQDGGHIIIGVREEVVNGRRLYFADGIGEEHLATFDSERLAERVRKYAEPYARFSADFIELDGKMFMVISVNGFDQYPVICKDNFPRILQAGVVYVRPESGPVRTAAISSYKEMRDLLDLATERGVRQLSELLARVGITGQADAELFDKQLDELR